jgi:hypothetical protein
MHAPAPGKTTLRRTCLISVIILASTIYRQLLRLAEMIEAVQLMDEPDEFAWRFGNKDHYYMPGLHTDFITSVRRK